MELETLADIVDKMVVEHDYPGFEPRSLKLGLPESANKAPSRLFAQALGHSNVYVKLAALRWFQDHPGMIKQFVNAIVGLFDSPDEWVRLEAVQTLERLHNPSEEHALKLCKLLGDSELMVRKAAAKATGKICLKINCKQPEILESLRHAAEDADVEVRWKAEKALRKLGAYQ